MKIKRIKITALLNITGVVNYNGSGSLKGHKNHKYAKRDSEGNDYTSANCLRQALFRKYVPEQPTTEELKKLFPQFMGTYAGLMRGGLEASTGNKRKSPLFVESAPTLLPADKKSLLVVEQGTSSKPKETDQKSTSKKKEGEKASDTSMFTFDTAGARTQQFTAIISIEDLQKISLNDKVGVVPPKSHDVFLKSLSSSLKELGADSKVEVKKYKPKFAVFGTPEEAVLLSNEQQAAFIVETMKLIHDLQIQRATANLEIDPSSISVQVNYEGGEGKTSTFTYKDFLDVLTKKNVEFSEFFAEV